MTWHPGMPRPDRGDDASASDRSEPCPLCGGTVAALRVERRGHAVSLSRAKLFPVLSVEVCDDLACDYARWQRAGRSSEAR
ncbi:hypothetical protein Sa4125_20940 [Aureimonas sp. SA4125]|uniref:hypothetical protein n=1 Tax=Aureimonas sp. SA4125 TaxID=2826993 RepID=UPI001CC5849D|nr:hypothetical protein [Aureimonas sp. SA4125]BDA84552.1 hypothetical protein Sa4125_20940 [Aureimonas sp. SA4125]